MSRDINREMLDYLPKIYGDSRVVRSIIDPESKEFTALNGAIREVLDQFFIDTATWGLERWERLCGIVPDTSKPYDQRRSVIKSRIRGVGTVKVALIKEVAEAYLNGEVDVVSDTANYHVVCTFIGKRGVPANMADIQKAIRDILPAHLGVTFKVTYLPWGELIRAGKTWGDLTSYRWDELKTIFL
ncbi:YmfQ family protein [Paenibacillus sp. 1P03SA]|uniref:YmfQ family protein n=1 Tax=Paenibacillus sp. 1P03SA TaxID=3132294 RepID=UPI00399F6EF7